MVSNGDDSVIFTSKLFLDVINFKNTPTDGPFYPVLIEMPTTHSRIRKFFSNVAGHVRRPCISGANPNDNKTDNKDAQLSLSTPAVGMIYLNSQRIVLHFILQSRLRHRGSQKTSADR